MKVFLSYSIRDKDVARQIASALRDGGHTVWHDESAMRAGDNLIKKIEEGIRDSDAIVVLFSEGYLSSKWAQFELSTWRLTGAVKNSKAIMPVRLDDTPLPLFLANRIYIDFRGNNVAELATRLAADLAIWERAERSAVPQVAPAIQRPPDDPLAKLKGEYMRGNLSLICGAGISMGAGIPGWNVLLRSLLTSLFDASSPATHPDATIDLVRVYQDRFTTSPLIVAQYLKNALGHDYRATLRKALYASNPSSSPLIDAICDLCRPQRAREALRSIVTFNFDDLLEQNLKRNRISARAIYSEGQKSEPFELPIYHVHGFLPRDGDPKEHELVFSEDAYHSQFIDPFSWSNLAQLSHFSSQTCLFIGLSITDPNLRRLLDVSMRKNPSKQIRHYAFRKRYDPTELASQFPGADSAQRLRNASVLAQMAQILEEDDANNLGLSIIWHDQFDDIIPMLTDLANTRTGHT